MDDKIVIEVYKTKSCDELTKLISERDSRLEAGSAAAVTAAMAAGLMLRAASLAPDGERTEYIRRNAEILRTYMVSLIDEDVKSRGPLRRAMKEGGAREIEASRHTASCISAEIINMMGQCLELLKELSELCPEDALHYVGEAGELAMAAVRSARIYVVAQADSCSDETYRFVTRRENDIFLENNTALLEAVRSRVEDAI